MKILSRITLSIIVTILCCISISSVSTSISPSVSALDFESSEQLQFTLNPSISINISSNLTIESLTPGDYKDSNIITVTASSNAVAGYSLTSAVGTSTNTSNELRKGGTDTTNKFTTLAGNQPALAGFNDNEWGYSYSICSTPACTEEPTWISGNTGSTLAGYDGYDYNTTTSTSETITHLATSTSGTSAIKYKIGAKSSATQLAGEYTNAINFIGITNPNPPIIYMQDATLADCGKSMVDRRDHNVYSTALVGDRCWMTTNLNLLGGTKLTHNDTDMSAEYETQGLPVANGFLSGNRLPESSTVGFDNNYKAFIYNSGNTSSNCSAPGCYSYYSWTAATIGSGIGIYTDNTDAPYSICPRGWHLPNIRGGTDSTSDFRALLITLGGSAEIANYDSTTTPTGSVLVDRLTGSPIYFLHSGGYTSSSFSSGTGFYWSSTSHDSIGARVLKIYSSIVYSTSDNRRYSGFPVRCVLNHD